MSPMLIECCNDGLQPLPTYFSCNGYQGVSDGLGSIRLVRRGRSCRFTQNSDDLIERESCRQGHFFQFAVGAEMLGHDIETKRHPNQQCSILACETCVSRPQGLGFQHMSDHIYVPLRPANCGAVSGCVGFKGMG
eukprot:Protomagalhaensia_sp_Gyna_25__2450@NODE_2367_length_1125_cov_6_651934_g1962_i0_p2_GENE_NODE_2367_length_1125_cov_6_651934_g1962_i0NODE_2367_length_1125_cov_6_651934_g1962_i0_p2_ORF_typecomplete_len135_score7_11ANATO/PF01821_18/0_081ANATO/PF01821_18/2e03ANATO/PF01821_18/4_7e03_NODE_2367_length_1125_cov_6_651934_g1962_i0230634